LLMATTAPTQLTLTCHASNHQAKPNPETLTIPKDFTIKFYTRRDVSLLVKEAE